MLWLIISKATSFLFSCFLFGWHRLKSPKWRNDEIERKQGWYPGMMRKNRKASFKLARRRLRICRPLCLLWHNLAFSDCLLVACFSNFPLPDSFKCRVIYLGVGCMPQLLLWCKFKIRKQFVCSLVKQVIFEWKTAWLCDIETSAGIDFRVRSLANDYFHY